MSLLTTAACYLFSLEPLPATLAANTLRPVTADRRLEASPASSFRCQGRFVSSSGPRPCQRKCRAMLDCMLDKSVSGGEDRWIAAVAIAV
jgi:hypothetical protein